jgi:serine/threonine-protein kinase HipA
LALIRKKWRKRPTSPWRNAASLRKKTGAWSLSPAYDVTYSYNAYGSWTAQHQMSLNGKYDHFTPEDFTAFARVAGMKRGRDKDILQEIPAQKSAPIWPQNPQLTDCYY